MNDLIGRVDYRKSMGSSRNSGQVNSGNEMKEGNLGVLKETGEYKLLGGEGAGQTRRGLTEMHVNLMWRRIC